MRSTSAASEGACLSSPTSRQRIQRQGVPALAKANAHTRLRLQLQLGGHQDSRHSRADEKAPRLLRTHALHSTAWYREGTHCYHALLDLLAQVRVVDSTKDVPAETRSHRRQVITRCVLYGMCECAPLVARCRLRVLSCMLHAAGCPIRCCFPDAVRRLVNVELSMARL